MRHGTVRESGPAAQVFAAPRDPYTRALLACRPRLDARPRRLPVIDDFMQGRPPEALPRAPRPAGAVPLIEVSGLRKVYPLKEGLWRRRQVEAVRHADFV